MSEFRWRLADGPETSDQGTLFDPELLLDRHVGTGEFRGIEFLHVNARRIINSVPESSRMPFRHTINAYRGCSHACSYCQHGDTPILMGDGTTRRLADLRVGDTVYGTVRDGNYRRYVHTPVLDHWSTVQPAWRVRLEDGTELIASGEHRYLTRRGWRHVYGREQGRDRRPHLTLKSRLVGIGHFAEPPKAGADYRRGYLCGVIRGGGTIGHYAYQQRSRVMRVNVFRLALTDLEAIDRAQAYLAEIGIGATRRPFGRPGPSHRPMTGLFNQRKGDVLRIEELIGWPSDPAPEWQRGFLAGIFDAAGSFSGSLRISNSDPAILGHTADALTAFDFDQCIEPSRPNGVTAVRLRGGLGAVLRFFHTVDPAILRKRNLVGRAVKGAARLGVVEIAPLGIDLPMYDITTGTEDFIANGVISHNCFARPTHTYLGLNTGADFESKIVVKVNAVERVRAELASPRWAGDTIAMGTNTDPYQRCEGKYHLTRGIVSALLETANPFSILTKSSLVVRDLDLLAEAAGRGLARVSFSIGTLDEEVWRLTEPGTPHPRQRLKALERLTAAGVECGVLVAPVLPGLSDRPSQVRAVVEACRDAGARSVSAIGLHLRPGVREHFLGWLGGARPDLVERYERLYGRGSYLPREAQERLGRTVADTRPGSGRNGSTR